MTEMVSESAESQKVHDEELELNPSGDIVSKDEPENDVAYAVRTDGPIHAGVVPRKAISNLTDAERKTILDNARNSIDNPYYDVKLFKNGSARICKRKFKEPSLSEKMIQNDGQRKVRDQTVYLSNDQLMWEHLMNLETKYNVLAQKHKKMKGKFKSLKNDIYASDDDQSGALPEPPCGLEKNVAYDAKREANGYVNPTGWENTAQQNGFAANVEPMGNVITTQQMASPAPPRGMGTLPWGTTGGSSWRNRIRV